VRDVQLAALDSKVTPVLFLLGEASTLGFVCGAEVLEGVVGRAAGEFVGNLSCTRVVKRTIVRKIVIVERKLNAAASYQVWFGSGDCTQLPRLKALWKLLMVSGLAMAYE